MLVAAGVTPVHGTEATALSGTAWRLVEFLSMGDRQGITRPREATLNTMRLHGGGTVAM